MIDKLLSVVGNKQAEDIDRIEALQDLLLEIDSEPDQLANIQSRLIEVIADADDDYLVRQHAAKELQHYRLATLDASLLEVLRNRNEDLDLRINLHDAVLHLSDRQLSETFANLDDDDEFKRYT